MSSGIALPPLRLTAEQILECRLVANRVEVGVPPRHLATALPHLDRPAEVLDGLGGFARQALAAGRVVGELSVVGVVLDQLAALVRRFGVPAGVERGRTEPQTSGPGRWIESGSPTHGCRHES